MPSHTRESNLCPQHAGADTRAPLNACNCLHKGAVQTLKVRVSALKTDFGEKNALSHQGVEPASTAHWSRHSTTTVCMQWHGLYKHWKRVCTENWPWREKCLVAPGSPDCVHSVPDWTLNHLRYIPATNKFQAQSFMGSPSKQHGHVYQPWQVLCGEFGAVNHLVRDGLICFLVGGAGTYCLVPWHLPPKRPWTTEMMTFMFLVKADIANTHTNTDTEVSITYKYSSSHKRITVTTGTCTYAGVYSHRCFISRRLDEWFILSACNVSCKVWPTTFTKNILHQALREIKLKQ